MSSKQKPAFHAFVVRERANGKKAIWTRIGAVWAHQEREDGKEGFSLELEAIPVNFDGRIVLMPPREEKESDPASTTASDD